MKEGDVSMDPKLKRSGKFFIKSPNEDSLELVWISNVFCLISKSGIVIAEH